MTDYKSRMIELKRKNTISNMSKEWKKESINIEITDFLAEYTQILLSNINEEQIYVFFVGEANEIGALLLKGDVILEKYSYIIKNSELFRIYIW